MLVDAQVSSMSTRRSGVEIELGIEPVPAPLQDVRAVLLGRMRGLF
jgi:hypothetical protein